MLVAARNEERSIGATVSALARAIPAARVWVVDDGSRDQTAALASAAGARVFSCPRALGKGAAMTLAAGGVLSELESGQEPVLLLCDGDLGSSAAELSELVEMVRCGSADIAVGAFRTSQGGGFGLALAFARWALRRRCGMSARAPISGQRALSVRSLEQLLPFAGGYGMELAMSIDAVRAGMRVVEVDLDLSHSAGGRTPAGFGHRARQLVDFMRVYLSRR